MEYLPTRRQRTRAASEASTRSDLPDHLADLESPMYGSSRSTSLNDLNENFFAKPDPEDMIALRGDSKHLHAVSQRYEVKKERYCFANLKHSIFQSLDYETVENDLYRNELNMPSFHVKRRFYSDFAVNFKLSASLMEEKYKPLGGLFPLRCDYRWSRCLYRIQHEINREMEVWSATEA